MARPKTKPGSPSDWFARARTEEHHLDATSPLWVGGPTIPYPQPLEMHMHKGMEIGIILSGGMELQFEDLVLNVGPGEFWLSAMWEPHAWRPTAPETRLPVVIFLPGMVEEIVPGNLTWLSMFAAPPRERPRAATPEMRARVLALGEELAREIEARPPDWGDVVRLDVVRFLVILPRYWRPEHPRRRRQINANDLSRILPAITLANSHLAERLDPEDAAKTCGLSVSWFHHVFRHTMGLSFGRFRLRARLAQAAHLLLTTDLTVAAIAEQSGFVDGSHLNRAFVAQYRCTPAEYRKRGRPRGGVTPREGRIGFIANPVG